MSNIEEPSIETLRFIVDGYFMHLIESSDRSEEDGYLQRRREMMQYIDSLENNDASAPLLPIFIPSVEKNGRFYEAWRTGDLAKEAVSHYNDTDSENEYTASSITVYSYRSTIYQTQTEEEE